MSLVPPLKVSKPGISVKIGGILFDGVKEVSDQIEPYTTWWDENNQKQIDKLGPLLVVMGDSAALGIGASKPENGYVELVRTGLSEKTGEDWRAIVLAQSGAKIDTALDEYLPIVPKLNPNLVISCIGSNDVFWSLSTRKLVGQVAELIERLPKRSVIASLAGMSARSALVNRAMRNEAKETTVTVVNPWNKPGVPGRHRIAQDKFHPNDYGYELMAEAFLNELPLS